MAEIREAAGFDFRLREHDDRVAIVDPAGTWSYTDLVAHSTALAAALSPNELGLREARIALLCTPGHDFSVALLACWRVGGLAVPVHPSHPDAELLYFLTDSDTSVIVCSFEYEDQAKRLADAVGADVVRVRASSPGTDPPAPVSVDPAGRALMLYTSGTTGRPKGVVHTHRGLRAQVDSLVEAWGWSSADRILLVLPLHHVHGVVNVVLCALWAGAVCEAPGEFDAQATWARLASGDITLFMAVPTIYTRLIAAWDAADAALRVIWSDGAAAARLMVSGSAALPVSTLERWREITGQVLLERYGMTELGMALSNTLVRRIPGKVGEPLPLVSVRIIDDDGRDLPSGQVGELVVRGPQLFLEYWRRSDETAGSFLDDWFRTGDVAIHETDGYRLLGRSSIDIIKTGGEKVSALEIEEIYRMHPSVIDCAVVGLPDDDWGERVCVAVVPDNGAPTADQLRAWGKERLAAAKVPTRFLFTAALPRNTMGKVTKIDVKKLFT